MDVVWLGESHAHEPSVVGGKAVVGTKRATAVLQDGQLVEVDGTSGTVRIIEA